jgi:hypothetical protein
VIEEKQHSLLAPSKAHRWVACPGSIPFCEGYPEQDSEAADNGTAAHEMGAQLLEGGCLPHGYDREMYSYVKVYVDDIKRRAEGKVLLVEQRVWIEPWTTEKGGFGTSDAIIFDPATGHLEVRDLKYGMVVVYAEENEQLMLYALGARHLVETFGYEVKTVTLAIHQPRRDHYDEWTVTLEKLLEFGNYARSRGMIALASMPGEELFATPKGCEYCPAKIDCPAYIKKVHETVFEEFTEVNGMPTAVARPVEAETTPGELDMVEAWVSAKRKWIFEQLLAGVPMKSWKLVEGRAGNRKFTNEEAVEGILKKMRFKARDIKETKLIPLTQIEKLVGKERWKHLVAFVKQNPGQPQMAPASDKRPQYQPCLVEEFDIIPQEEFKNVKQ